MLSIALAVALVLVFALRASAEELSDEMLTDMDAVRKELSNFSGRYKRHKCIDLAKRSLEQVEKVKGKDHPDARWLLLVIGVEKNAIGEYQDAIEHLENGLTLAEELDGANSFNVARFSTHLAFSYKMFGEVTRSNNLLNTSTTIIEYLIHENADKEVTLKIAKLLITISRNYVEIEDKDSANTVLQKAVILFREYLKENREEVGSLNTARYYTSLADAFIQVGDKTRAKDYLEEAFSILKLIDTDYKRIWFYFVDIGQHFYKMDDLTRAEDIFLFFLSWGEKNMGTGGYRMSICRGLLSDCYMKDGDYRNAEMMLTKNYEVEVAEKGEYNATDSISLVFLVDYYEKIEDFDKAISIRKRRLDYYMKENGEDDIITARAMHDLGCDFYEVGNYEEAKPLFARASLVREKRLGHGLDTVYSIVKHAEACEKTGDSSQAKELLEKALGILRETWGKDHPDTIDVANKLANYDDRNKS